MTKLRFSYASIFALTILLTLWSGCTLNNNQHVVLHKKLPLVIRAEGMTFRIVNRNTIEFWQLTKSNDSWTTVSENFRVNEKVYFADKLPRELFALSFYSDTLTVFSDNAFAEPLAAIDIDDKNILSSIYYVKTYETIESNPEIRLLDNIIRITQVENVSPINVYELDSTVISNVKYGTKYDPVNLIQLHSGIPDYANYLLIEVGIRKSLFDVEVMKQYPEMKMYYVIDLNTSWGS